MKTLKLLALSICLMLMASPCKASTEILYCDQVENYQTMFICRPQGGNFQLDLSEIKRIKNRDKLSIYFKAFHKKNILIFQSEEQKNRIVNYWKKKYNATIKFPDLLETYWFFKDFFDK